MKLNPRQPLLVGKSTVEIMSRFILPNLLADEKFLTCARKIPKLDQLPRELFGLCILCYMGQFFTKLNWVPATDPGGRDGIVFCKDGVREGEGIRVEQVYIPKKVPQNLQEAILNAVNNKNSYGKSYSDGYALVVFIDKDGEVDIKNLLPAVQGIDFASCWLIGKLDKKLDNLNYYVALLKSSSGDPLGDYIVSIDKLSGEGVVKKINK
jgi:hypothetical protein